MNKAQDRQEIRVGFETLKELSIEQIQQIEKDYNDYEDENTRENHL